MKSNDNSDSIHISFRLYEKTDFQSIQKIRNFKKLGYDTQSDLLRAATLKFFENGSQKHNLKEQYDEQKLKKIKKEIIKLDIENKIKLIHQLGKEPSEAFEIANGTKILDEDAIHCLDCSWSTNSKDSMNYQINSLTSHMKTIHNRSLTEKEAEELTRLLI